MNPQSMYATYARLDIKSYRNLFRLIECGEIVAEQNGGSKCDDESDEGQIDV